MRCFLLAGILAVLAVGASQSSAQQMAIPTTVNGLIKSPPKVGQLIQVSGYLVTTDKQPKLQDTDSGRKINLDFSRSQVTLDKLGATEAKSSPVMIIGRLQDSKDNGKPTIIVVGAINLTP